MRLLDGFARLVDICPSLRLAELPRAGVMRPSLRILAKAFALSFREARMNLISRNAGEESVVVARK